MATSSEARFGEWGHCGSAKPHHPHMNSFAMNEGRYDVPCAGTTDAEYREYMMRSGVHYTNSTNVTIKNCYIGDDEATTPLLEYIEGSATQEEGSMQTRSEVIAARMAQLEKELSSIKVIEDGNIAEDGTIVKYVRRLGSGDEMQDFTYVAVRAAGRWFTTASRPQDANLTEEAFFAVLAGDRTTSVVVLKEDRKIK